MSLPLPEPSFEWPSLCKYNESELEAYGQACREAALEEVINFYSPDDTATDLLDKIKAKIGVAP